MKTMITAAHNRWVLTIILTTVFAACHAEPRKETNRSSADSRQCLYTWASRDSDFCFALIPFEECDKFLRSSAKPLDMCGLPKLAAALKSLPKGSEILWENNPSRGFDYPPDEVVEQIKRLGEEQGTPVVITPLLIEH